MAGESSGAGEDMILVFGLPRSGTSWIGKIFDSHPDTLYLHEPDKHIHLPDVPMLLPAEPQKGLDAFLRQVLANRSPGVTGKLPAFTKSYRSGARHLARNAAGYLARALPRRLAERVRVPDLVDPDRHPGPRLVWKSINSVGRLGALARLLPNARCLLLLRHPCGQIASVLRGYSSGMIQGPPPSEHYRVLEMLLDTDRARARGLTLDALRAMHPVERMAWRWVLLLEKAVADTASLANCRLLRYEDLCAAPVEGARELFGFTGLAWHTRTEEFIRESTDGESERYFGLRKNPARSATKWQRELSEADARRIFYVTGSSPVGRLYPEERPEPSNAVVPLLGPLLGPPLGRPMGPILAEGLSLPT
jgi:hypothetical protein